MHDPDVLAFTIPRPWPRLAKHHRTGRRRLAWPGLIDVWHVEPGGKDALTVCGRNPDRSHNDRWKAHFWHWRIQVWPLQKLKRSLFERCTECGRRYSWGYAPVSNGWDEPAGKWFRVQRRSFHFECFELVSLRRQRGQDEQIIRHLHEGTTPLMEWALSYRLNKILESGHAE